MENIKGKIVDIKINDTNNLHVYGVDIGELHPLYVSVFLDADKGFGRDFFDTVKTISMGDVVEFSVTSSQGKTGRTFYNIKGVNIIERNDEPFREKPVTYSKPKKGVNGATSSSNRDTLIIRQVTAKCAAQIMSAVIGNQGLEGVGAEEYIIIAKRLEQYILTGE